MGLNRTAASYRHCAFWREVQYDVEIPSRVLASGSECGYWREEHREIRGDLARVQI